MSATNLLGIVGLVLFLYAVLVVLPWWALDGAVTFAQAHVPLALSVVCTGVIAGLAFMAAT